MSQTKAELRPASCRDSGAEGASGKAAPSHSIVIDRLPLIASSTVRTTFGGSHYLRIMTTRATTMMTMEAWMNRPRLSTRLVQLSAGRALAREAQPGSAAAGLGRKATTHRAATTSSKPARDRGPLVRIDI